MGKNYLQPLPECWNRELQHDAKKVGFGGGTTLSRWGFRSEDL